MHMLNLDDLRGLDLQRPNLEELIFLSAAATIMRAEFDKLGVDSPEWLDTRARELRREIRTRQQDAIDKRTREIRSRLDALKTPSEKRAELEAELEKLTAGAGV
jgi:DNA repair exonuclease SbcCD ATPase subunit